MVTYANLREASEGFEKHVDTIINSALGEFSHAKLGPVPNRLIDFAWKARINRLFAGNMVTLRVRHWMGGQAAYTIAGVCLVGSYFPLPIDERTETSKPELRFLGQNPTLAVMIPHDPVFDALQHMNLTYAKRHDEGLIDEMVFSIKLRLDTNFGVHQLEWGGHQMDDETWKRLRDGLITICNTIARLYDDVEYQRFFENVSSPKLLE